MRNWKMHLSVQLTTFVVFPLLVLPFYPLLQNTNMEIFWMGMFFLAALPSTVSSSVVMVSIAGGNIPGAIFNASISGMIGIIMTPFWMGLFLSTQTVGLDFSHVLLQLITQIILPVVAGLFLHKFLARWTDKHIYKLAAFDRIIILLIVYESFSNSFMSGIFSSVSWTACRAFCCCNSTVFIIINFTRSWPGFLNFHARQYNLQFAGKKNHWCTDRFCNVLFGNISTAGIWLLPIMIYHSFQLFYISIIARKMQMSDNGK